MTKVGVENGENTHTVRSTTKWSTGKKVVTIAIIVSIIIGTIILAIVLGVVLSQKTSSTEATTTTAAPTVTVYWSLDSVTSDSTNIYNGTLMNSASFFSTTSSQPFVAYGRGLTLTSSSSQYMRVSSPFLDLTYKSFTIEAWIFSSATYVGDNGILGQCQCTTCANQCLYLLIRSSRLYAGFTFNDVSGSFNLTNNYWYHVAFVYDYEVKQQILYLNGVQDTVKSNADPYQGTNGTIDIGSSLSLSVRNFFNGYIDNVKITTRAKSSYELLTAATLTAYFSFDVSGPYNDNGPNSLNGTAINSVIVAGRVNQAIRFTGSSSYFYAYGLYQVGYGVYSARPFSVSLWINPSAISSSAIVQFATALSSYTCHNLIGIWSSLGVTGQIHTQGWSWPTIIGPFVTVNTWMHVSVTYSPSNGIRLYVNGIYIGTTGAFSFTGSGSITYLQLGYMNPCTSGSISNGAYQGSVDEIYVHSREITSSEVSILANV